MRKAEVWGGTVEKLANGTQYRHYCLEVTEITMGMDRSWQAWVTDPDGNRIELMEYGPSSLELKAM